MASLLLLLVLSAALGGVLVAAIEPGRRRIEPALWLLAGLVALHVLLLVFDLAGVPWRRGALAAGWAGTVALAALGVARRPPAAGVTTRRPPGRHPLGWGDGVALLALSTYAAAAWTRGITIPDYIYHWGLKAKRHLLAGGIDYAFLADPLRLTDHPDYPSFVPALYATIGVIRGAFHERAALVASAVFFALALAGTRRAVTSAGMPRHAVQGTVAAVALTLAMFGIGYRMAGGADWPLVAAILLALPALIAGRPATDRDAGHGTLRLGLAAALAAGSKIEGVPLAGLLVAAGLIRWAPAWWRSAGTGRPQRSAVSELARLVGPPTLVVIPWVVQNLRHGLFASENTGPLVAARIPVMLTSTFEVFTTSEWYGLPWLLLLLPWLGSRPATRVAAGVLMLQGGFYAWVFLTSPVDTRFLVLSSLPRLLFHLVPPALVLLALAFFAGRQSFALAAAGDEEPADEELSDDPADDPLDVEADPPAVGFASPLSADFLSPESPSDSRFAPPDEPDFA